MDIEIKIFEKFWNSSADFKKATFETPVYPKTKKIRPEVWKLGKRSKVDMKIQNFGKFWNLS